MAQVKLKDDLFSTKLGLFRCDCMDEDALLKIILDMQKTKIQA